MKAFLEKFVGAAKADKLDNKSGINEHLKYRVNALYELLSNVYGSDKLVLRAGKLDALQLMRSEVLCKRVLALQKIIFEDAVSDTVPSCDQVPEILEQIEDKIADYLARRSLEEELERKIKEKMNERQEDYLQEIKLQVLKENTGTENAQTLKKLAVLEKLELKKLSSSAMEFLRPSSFAEIVGQERAVKALLSKLASPFPQHIILYGPPGVGKTTAARLALEAAKNIRNTPFAKDAPFIEVNGTTLRWDAREITNPLLGSVHDPIYQGARRDLADSGIPEPKLGLVTEAHGGILFIDEIGEMDPILQNKLLKVLEDKRVFFESAYYDPSDQGIPQYIKKIFEYGAPADFLLIGATTRGPEDINPAIRSRCAEVYFDPLTPGAIKKIVTQASCKLNIQLEEKVAEIISEYTIEGRKAVNILADAYGISSYRNDETDAEQKKLCICDQDIYDVVQTSRLTPYVLCKASPRKEVGKIFGLGVMGFIGSVLEIEAITFPARQSDKGTIRFNDTAGSMAKDSVFNAASVIRKLTGEDLSKYDVHINIIGGGRIDGPSAGVAMLLAVFSTLQNCPVPQDIAVTGEVSIQGKIRAVGGIAEKIYGARQAGINTVFVPAENFADIPRDIKNIKVIPVLSVEEIISNIFPDIKFSLSVS